METQEIYDTIMKHLRNQNEKAEDGGGSCLYRTEDGMKCAVGCLIPDEFYNSKMEGYTLEGLIKDFSGALEYLKIENQRYSSKFKLLYDMQCIHDGGLYPDKGWIKEAKLIGEKYNLQTDGR